MLGCINKMKRSPSMENVNKLATMKRPLRNTVRDHCCVRSRCAIWRSKQKVMKFERMSKLKIGNFESEKRFNPRTFNRVTVDPKKLSAPSGDQNQNQQF